MKPKPTIADPVVSRRGHVYSLKALKRLLAALARGGTEKTFGCVLKDD